MWTIIDEFKKFALRGNVVDLAVGFTVGAAFTTIVRSLVDDIIMPVVGLIVGRVEFSDLFWLLSSGPEIPPPYATLADAQAAGAVTVNYGIFINNVLAFLIVTLVMFMLIKAINKVKDQVEGELGRGEETEKETEPAHKECPYCISTIPLKATRCPQCTSQLDHKVSVEPVAQVTT